MFNEVMVDLRVMDRVIVSNSRWEYFWDGTKRGGSKSGGRHEGKDGRRK